MGTPLSPLTSVILGLLCAFYAFLVETQSQDVPSSPLFTSPPPPRPPPPSLAQPPPPPLPSPFPSSPPPPSPSSQSLPPPSRSKGSPPPRLRRQRKKRKQPPPPPPPPLPARHRMNTGKKVGLLFVGIVAILQIGVVGFLVFKRKQLLKIKDRYENFPA